MYSEEKRFELLRCVVDFIKDCHEFRCLIQIGSGVNGFTDIYSDIDLMAGCVNDRAVAVANDKLCAFFHEIGAVYLDRRKWADTILGLSVYFENGLSVDLSFMPVYQIPIATRYWKLLWSADEKIESDLVNKTNNLSGNSVAIDEKFHHSFFYALRKAKIAVLRQNYIYADIALQEARQKLLLVEAMVEDKKVHQFKAYHTLAPRFLRLLQQTYPQGLNESELSKALDSLLSLYVRTIEENGLHRIDPSQYQIIRCFSL